MAYYLIFGTFYAVLARFCVRVIYLLVFGRESGLKWLILRFGVLCNKKCLDALMQKSRICLG